MTDDPETFPTAADIDEVLAEFAGDRRAAIGALLKDLAALADDYAADTSRGYTRGQIVDFRVRRACEA